MAKNSPGEINIIENASCNEIAYVICVRCFWIITSDLTLRNKTGGKFYIFCMQSKEKLLYKCLLPRPYTLLYIWYIDIRV